MSNPYVDNLIQQLGGILQQNREKRNAADAMLMGIEQGKQRAALEAKNKQTIETGYGGDTQASAYGGQNIRPKSAHMQYGSKPPDLQTGYGGETGASAYGGAAVRPQAAGSTPESRMALAQKMIQSQGLAQEDANVANDPEDPNGQDPLGLGSISPNYQNGNGLGTLSKNYRAGGASKAAEDFIRARSTPNEPLDPSVAGALRTDPKQAAAIDAAGRPDTGNFGSIAGNTNMGGPASSYGGDKAYSLKGTSPSVGDLRASVRGQPSPDDMALLNELAKRYHSPEELSGR